MEPVARQLQRRAGIGRSFIEKLAYNADYVLPDRSQVVITRIFLRAYSLLPINTWHHCGAFVMGSISRGLIGSLLPQQAWTCDAPCDWTKSSFTFATALDAGLDA
ncbi:hypothetical protein ACXIUS_29680 [Bosea thiooxidans]